MRAHSDWRMILLQLYSSSNLILLILLSLCTVQHPFCLKVIWLAIIDPSQRRTYLSRQATEIPLYSTSLIVPAKCWSVHLQNTTVIRWCLTKVLVIWVGFGWYASVFRDLFDCELLMAMGMYTIVEPHVSVGCWPVRPRGMCWETGVDVTCELACVERRKFGGVEFIMEKRFHFHFSSETLAACWAQTGLYMCM